VQPSDYAHDAARAGPGEPELRVTRSGRVHRLTLNRPHVGNALNQGLAEAFRAEVTTIAAADQPQIVVLKSTGSLFCAGGDLGEVLNAGDPEAYLTELASTMAAAVATMRQWSHLLVAQVQGAAAGAGLALVLNSDLVIAADTATFLSAYTRVGLTPDCGLSALLPAVVGPRRAAELTLTNRKLTAAEAHRWGMVNEVVAADELGPRVDAVAEQLAAGASHAQAGTNALLKTADRRPYDDHLRAEVDNLAHQIRLDDTLERLHQFLYRSASG